MTDCEQDKESYHGLDYAEYNIFIKYGHVWCLISIWPQSHSYTDMTSVHPFCNIMLQFNQQVVEFDWISSIQR